MCPTILEVSFICLLGIAVIGKIGRHVRFLLQKKRKKKEAVRFKGKYDIFVSAGYLHVHSTLKDRLLQMSSIGNVTLPFAATQQGAC